MLVKSPRWVFLWFTGEVGVGRGLGQHSSYIQDLGGPTSPQTVGPVVWRQQQLSDEFEKTRFLGFHRAVIEIPTSLSKRPSAAPAPAAASSNPLRPTERALEPEGAYARLGN